MGETHENARAFITAMLWPGELDDPEEPIDDASPNGSSPQVSKLPIRRPLHFHQRIEAARVTQSKPFVLPVFIDNTGFID
jgi:hypothetical protein